MILGVEWWRDPRVLFDGAGIAIILFIVGLVVQRRRTADARKVQHQRSGERSINVQAGRDIKNVDVGDRNAR
jgi:hypothetical protein